ncbi:MAG: amidohydrolase family protein [Myxococcales bacterium]|nr:amidohydrolase family protein [Myxococcales bacterium]
MRFRPWQSSPITRTFSLLGLCGLCLLAACAEDKTTADGSDGGSGGSSGSAGNGGTGGDIVAGSGGDAGTAGSGASGGTGASGGAGATGGAGGSSGSAGSSGNGGIGGVGPDATITDGAEDRILLTGLVVTPDQAFDGQVLVEGEDITCVEMGTGCEGQSGASGATRIDTNGIILPGLIDTHNHIFFDLFNDDDWVPNLPSSCSTVDDCVAGASYYCRSNRCDCVDSVCRYKNHNQWNQEAEYALMLDYKQCFEDVTGKPIWCPIKYDDAGKLACELDKWGELKGMIAGTTSIVGLPAATNYPCVASLSRSIDVKQNDLPDDKIQASSLGPPADATSYCTNYSDGTTDAFLVHAGEGVDATALAEWDDLNTLGNPVGCLIDPKTTVTHGTAFTKTQFDVMGAVGMKLTWSPASNVALYGKTTDIPTALDSGVLVSIAPDWSMGGSQNLLDELRFADNWDNSRWNDRLSPEDLVRMATVNAAEVLGLQDVLGSIKVGLKADLFVIGGDTSRPFDSVLAATPRDVRLVMVGGRALFGDDQLELAGPASPGCETFTACGRNKFLCVAEDSSADKLAQTRADIEGILNAALQDLDTVPELPASDCGNACDSDEACYARTNIPMGSASDCAATCGAGEACFRTSASAYNCRTINACSGKKTKTFYPVAPLVSCN